MNIVLGIYLVLIAFGVFGDAFKAVRYRRAEAENSSKLAALMLAKAVLGLASFGIVVWLWYGEVASPWTIFIAVLPVAGIIAGAIVLYENKLSTGKFISIPDLFGG
jgi:hypothetical protein